MLTGRKLALTLVFTVLVALAFGVSCKGFFTNPVLTSIAISPTAPQVNVGDTETLQVFGTYDDGTRKVVTSGVTWSSDMTGVATIDQNTGILTGVAPGSAGISASAQALPATATATVILTGVTDIMVSPLSGSVTKGGTGFTFTFTADPGSVPITSDDGGIITITPASSDVTCTVSGNDEVCAADTNASSGQYSIKMTYPGTSKFATATLTVN